MTDIQPYSPEPLAELPEPYPTEAPWQGPPARTGRSMVGRILGILTRYRWLLIGALVLGGGGATVAWKLTQLEYHAQGSLWVNQNSSSEGGGPISEAGLLKSLEWLNLLKSFSVLDPVVVEQRLYLEHDPKDADLFKSFRITEGSSFRSGSYELDVAADGGSYTLRSSTGVVVETGAPGDSIGAPLGFVWTPPASELTPDRSVAFEVLSPRDASVRLREAIEASMDPRLGTFIQLGLSNQDPKRAASVLQSVMQRTVDVAKDLKGRKLDETNRVLEEQLSVVETDLRTAEQELEGFRVRTISLPTDQSPAIAPGLQQTQASALDAFFQLRLDLEDTRRDREQLETVLSSQDSVGLRVSGLELIPSARQSTQLTGYLAGLAEARSDLRTLEERYTEEYQGVRDARARVETLEQVTIPNAVRSVVAELKAREAELSATIGTRTTELEQIPPRMIEEARLERRVEIATRLYTELRQRYETSSLASRSSVPDVQILDTPAVPTVPEGDKRVRMALMVFGAVFGCGLGLAVVLDRMDPRLRDPYDVTGEFGLPLLGAVPRLNPSAPDSEGQVREAFRELRINVEYAHGPTRPLVICVTSPAEKEGKSFVSANLAIAFAGLKRRTLLVDGDTRRGNAHELFGLGRKPGLTDFLLTNRAPARIQQTGYDNLWILSCGSRHAASPELLNSANMQSLMAAAKKRFDVIILDSPPLSAGADAMMLAAHAGSLALVVRNGATNKALTMVKLEPVLRLPVRILGAIINDLPNSRLYGSYKYYGDYLPGYGARDEPPEQIAAADASPPALTS